MKQAEIFGWSAHLVQAGKADMVLKGKVFDHPTLPQYTDISTNVIVKIEARQNRYYATTRSGSVYRLGVMDGDWAARHPKAKQQMMNHFLRLPARV